MDKDTSQCRSDFDKRILVRKLAKGEISTEELEAYLANLPDVSSCADEIEIE